MKLAPPWTREADRLLALAAQGARLLGRATPTNLLPELERLERSWLGAGPAQPRFEYVATERDRELERRLLQASERWREEGSLGRCYAERAAELRLELELASLVGSPPFARLATRRYAARDDFGAQANALAQAWLEAPGVTPEVEGSVATVRTDDANDPSSLLRRMQAEVGRLRLPVRVLARDAMSALAATGEGVVLVARGRLVTPTDVERTVLHELHGHVLPRCRAATSPLGLLALGTAQGSEDQEGRALLLEERAGYLEGWRRRELALRHVAVRALEGGADFVATVEALAGHEPDLRVRLRIAARVHRGGGLGRERIYLPGLLRVRATLARDPKLEAVLSAGQVSVEAAPLLAPYLTSPESDAPGWPSHPGHRGPPRTP